MATTTPAPATAAPATTPKTTAAEGLKKFNDLIANPRTQSYLAEVLSEKKSQFVNNIVALVSNSDNLQLCDPQSIMFAGIKATALNLPLDPNLGFAFIIPYWDNKTKTQKAQFQIGKNGQIQLAIRSGQVKTINVTDIREGEIEEENLLTGEIKVKRAADRETRKIIGYAAYLRLVNGFEKIMYSTREQIEQHALRYSKQQKDGRLTNVWATNFDEMAEKTVLKAVLKYAPLSTEIQQAINAVGSEDDIEGAAKIATVRAAQQEAQVVDIEPEPSPAPAPKAAAAPQPVAQSIETRQASF